MSKQLYLHIFLSVSNVYLQTFDPPSDPLATNAEYKSLKGCKTITYKEKDFNIVGKIRKNLPKDCVNNVKLEKDGEIYCIGKGDDKLQCKDKQGKNELLFSLNFPKVIGFSVVVNPYFIVPVCKCGVSANGGLFQNQGTH